MILTKRILPGILGGIIGALFGLLIGLIMGTFIGGNFLQEFLFNGVRGYEAVAQVGAIFGVPIGAGCGILLAIKIVRNKH